MVILESEWSIWNQNGQSGVRMVNLESERSIWSQNGESRVRMGNLESEKPIWSQNGESRVGMRQFRPLVDSEDGLLAQPPCKGQVSKP